MSGSTPKRLVKVLIVGDADCGKTCMLTQLTEQRFIDEHVPTVVDKHSFIMDYKQQQVELEICDTGESVSDSLALFYRDTHVILLCYSTAERETWNGVDKRWSTHIKSLCPKVPIVLVGNKVDIRVDRSPSPVENLVHAWSTVVPGSGSSMAKDIGAYSYRECSAKTNVGIEEVFQTAVEATLKKKKWKQSAINLFCIH